MEWSWDETLYAGSAGHYVRGRVPYPDDLAAGIATAAGLDGTQRLLDVGCGPGSLILAIAQRAASAVGVDPDPGMLAAAAALAAERGIGNVEWVRLRAEDLPAGLGRFDLVTFAQSFHWMDRDRVAGVVRRMLDPNGALVHVHASTNRGDPVAGATYPPWDAIDALVRRYLGSDRRAGQGIRTPGPGGDEEEVYGRAGFIHVDRFEVPGALVSRGPEAIVDSTHSLSWAAPHLFGDRLAAFDAELRTLIGPGPFTEQLPTIAVDVFR